MSVWYVSHSHRSVGSLQVSCKLQNTPEVEGAGLTFQTSQSIVVTVFARSGLVYPTWVAVC